MTHFFAGYYIEGEDHANRSIISTCQDSGLFQFTKSKCVAIPCLDEDIYNITPLNGLFMTDDEGGTKNHLKSC